MNSLNVSPILLDLIRIPSVTGDAEAGQTIVAWCQQFLKKQGVTATIIRSGPKPIIIWGETNLAQTRWLLNSHLDVVPGHSSQFEPRISKGKIWGRGAADTKSSVALLLSHAALWEPMARQKHLTFMLVLDEETGGESSRSVLPAMPMLRGAIFLEPTNEKMVVKAKGIMQAKIVVHGRSAHGSRPWDGVNAITLLTTQLAFFNLRHQIPQHETQDTTFNFSQLTAGAAINQVPTEATLWCDIRWHPHADPTAIIQELTFCFPNSTVEIIKQESPVNCPVDSPLRQSFAWALKQNSINPLPSFAHGSSDARHCTALGIPSLVFGPRGKNPHGDDEWISLKSLNNIQQVLGTWIKNL